MPVFNYKGIDGRGKEVKGLVDVDGEKALRGHLKRKGIYLTEYREGSKRGRRSGRLRSMAGPEGQSGGLLGKDVGLGNLFSGVKLIEVAEVTRHLSTLTKASIPVVEALQAVIEQIENERLKTVLASVRRAVTEGASLADAMAQHPKVFSRMYINMTRAGETSGTLDLVFSRLAELLEGQVRLRSKVTAALTYPFIMILIGVGVVALMMVMVIPKFQDMFDQMNVPLPWPTRLVIGVSDFMANWWWALIILFVGLATAFIRWKKSEDGRRAWDKKVLNMRVIGPLTREIALARFCRTMGTLLGAGVPLLTSMEIVKGIVDNRVLEDVIENAQNEVREGQSLAVPLKQSGEFPPMVCQMIATGERSGQLEEMLINAANAYEVQVDSKLTQLTALLEPIMIVVMGGFVGLMLGAILMPLLDMNKAFSAMN